MAVEFHGRPAELGRMQHKALEVFKRNVFREVSQPNRLRHRSDIDYAVGPGGGPNLQVNVVT